ncbi:MAG: hypothetical protein M3R70_10810 [Actinomycetota bacterium]|nr:hypothetical protein [Actinomycetota bacterium]
MRVLAVAAVLAVSAATYTVGQVQRSFRAQTGVRLVNLGSATTRDVTTLAPTPAGTARFGSFELYVLRPATARRTRRAILTGAKRDSRGIYWTRDQQGGWAATTVFGKNLVCGWFPRGGKKRVNAQWKRLQTILRRIR